MAYWIFLIISFVALVVCLIVIWKKRIKDDNMTNEDLKAIILLGGIILFCLIPFIMDLPSALNGGQEIYVNELPTVHSLGGHFSFVETDNEKLKPLKFGNWNKYEKYGNYRIRYNKLFKFVLEIEPID